MPLLARHVNVRYRCYLSAASCRTLSFPSKARDRALAGQP